MNPSKTSVTSAPSLHLAWRFVGWYWIDVDEVMITGDGTLVLDNVKDEVMFTGDKVDGHINVIAELRAKPEHADEVRYMLEGLVEPSRAEDGCKGYHLLMDKTDSSSFYTYEEWTSEDKLKQHLAGAKPMLDKARHLLASDMKLTVLEHLV